MNGKRSQKLLIQNGQEIKKGGEVFVLLTPSDLSAAASMVGSAGVGIANTVRGRPSEVYIPCQSMEGAVRDFRAVVMDYKTFSGWGCYRKLPRELRAEHEKYVAYLATLPEIQNVKDAWWHNVASVYYPCGSEASAVADYVVCVLDYWWYSGDACFPKSQSNPTSFLPSRLVDTHRGYVNHICNMFPQVAQLVNPVSRGL